jgi:hypothetical protein
VESAANIGQHVRWVFAGQLRTQHYSHVSVTVNHQQFKNSVNVFAKIAAARHTAQQRLRA